MMRAKKGGIYLALHALVLFYSLSALCSKKAASYPFASPGWLLFYGAVILILGLYAVFWQQIIKRLPLSTAYLGADFRKSFFRGAGERPETLRRGADCCRHCALCAAGRGGKA